MLGGRSIAFGARGTSRTLNPTEGKTVEVIIWLLLRSSETLRRGPNGDYLDEADLDVLIAAKKAPHYCFTLRSCRSAETTALQSGHIMRGRSPARFRPDEIWPCRSPTDALPSTLCTCVIHL